MNRAISAASFEGVEIGPIFPDLDPSHWAYYAIIEAAVEHLFVYNDEGLEIWLALID